MGVGGYNRIWIRNTNSICFTKYRWAFEIYLSVMSGVRMQKRLVTAPLWAGQLYEEKNVVAREKLETIRFGN